MATLIQSFLVVIGFTFSLISYHQFGLSILTLLPAFIFNQFLSHSEVKNKLVLPQLLLDILVAYLLIYINGAFNNPFYLVLLIHIFIAPFFLSRKRSALFVIFGLFLLYSLKYSTFNFGEYLPSLFKENLNGIGLVFVGLIVWQLSTWLVKELKKVSERVGSLQQYGQRIDKFRSLGLLTSGICHELGTPLNTALMKLSRATKKGELSLSDIEMIEKNLSKCADSLKKLNLKVHDLDDSFYKEEIRVLDIINEVSEEYSQNYPLLIVTEYKVSNEVTLQMPKLLFIRSVVDILDNAKDAGATKVHICIDEVSERNQLQIDFIDNGEGFSEEVSKHLGTPFVTSKETGTGLGLYQLMNTVGTVGGRVKVLKPEMGAVIRLIFPLEEKR